jgi:hypothetical protein
MNQTIEISRNIIKRDLLKMSKKNKEEMIRQMRKKVIKVNFLILNEIIKYKIFDETFIYFTIL